MTNHHINTFSIETALNEGWRLTKKNWGGLLALGLLSMVIGAAITLVLTLIFGVDALTNLSGESDLSNFILNLIYTLLYSVFAINSIKILIDYTRGHELKILNIFEMSQPLMRQAFKFFLASILYGLIMMLGFILFIVPGIYFAVKYGFVFNILADKDITISEAFKLAGKITEGNIWKLLGLYFVSTLIVLLGIIVLIVGIIPAIMITYMAYFYVYTHLMDKHVAHHETHPATPHEAEHKTS
jgi:hypothetical protein